MQKQSSNTRLFKEAKYSNNRLLTTVFQNIHNSQAKILSRIPREVKNKLRVLA